MLFVNISIKTQKFRRKNFGGNIFGRFLHILAENFRTDFIMQEKILD